MTQTPVQWSASKWLLRPAADWGTHELTRISYAHPGMYTYIHFSKSSQSHCHDFNCICFALLWNKIPQTYKYEIWVHFLTVSVHQGPEWTNPGPLLKIPIAAINVSPCCCSFWAWGGFACSCSCWQASVPFSLASFFSCWLSAEGPSQSLEATYIALHCGILSQHGTSLL